MDMSVLREIDPYLIEMIKQGDPISFKAVYDLLYKQIFALIFSIIKNTEQAEDILQETFIRLWLNKEKISSDQPLVPYVYVTARRLTIDAFRKASCEANFKQNLSFKLCDSTDETQNHILLNDLQKFTKEMVNKLPPQQQVVYRLSREEGQSYDEIAANLKISRNTVRNHLVRALKTLKNALASHLISLFLFGWIFLYFY